MTSCRIWMWRLFALAWAVNMYWMSTGGFSGPQTGSLLARILALLDIHLSAAAFGILHTLLRKLAHVVEYAVLAFLVYGSLGGRRRRRWCIPACVVFSLADELHQVFVPGRGASLFDCAIDLAGAGFAVLLIYSLDVRRAILPAAGFQPAPTLISIRPRPCAIPPSEEELQL